ncbi:MAG: HEAT repeat domain-containing protein [Pseudomonadota bacterium]
MSADGTPPEPSGGWGGGAPGPAAPRLAVIAPLIRQHAEEAAYLWYRRSLFIDDPLFTAVDIGRLDHRINAHLAGIDAAGQAGREMALEIHDEDPTAGTVFLIAATALADATPGAVDAALEIAFALEVLGLRGVSGALARTEPAVLRPYVASWLDAAEGRLRLLGLAALSHHRAGGNARLPRLLEDPDEAVRLRALRLVGETGRVDCLDAVETALTEDAPAVRMEAAWSAVLLGTGEPARPVLEAQVLDETFPDDRRLAAIDLRLLAGDGEERRRWLGTLLKREDALAEMALAAAGGPGERDILPWLLRQMTIPEKAAAAGRAFRDLFAIDFNDTDLFTEDASRLGPSFADREDTPLPDAARIKAWLDDGGAAPEEETEPSMRQLRLRALRAAAASPAAPLENWRRSRLHPAWM